MSSVPESSEKAESSTKVNTPNTTTKKSPTSVAKTTRKVLNTTVKVTNQTAGSQTVTVTTTKKAVTTTKKAVTTNKITSTTATTATTIQTTTKKSTTTAKPTSTTKKQPETTKQTTTKVVTTTPPTTTEPVPTGTFTFTVYGYGHGVGMSQWGAIYKAKAGMTYTQILKHYYPGTSIAKDETLPEKVKFKGVEYSLEEYLYRATFAELGTTGNPVEAVKANVLAIYTNAKKRNFVVGNNLHGFAKSLDAVTSFVKSAVDSVIGEYITYDGVPINALFFSMCAGRTISAQNAWGGTSYPYLVSVESAVDLQNSKCKTTRTFTAAELKAQIKETTGIELTGDPETWLHILGHDSAINAKLGYVDRIQVGNKTFRGIYFKETIMDNKLRSHCFNFTYTPG